MSKNDKMCFILYIRRSKPDGYKGNYAQKATFVIFPLFFYITGMTSVGDKMTGDFASIEYPVSNIEYPATSAE
jgi:hypothetical protein